MGRPAIPSSRREVLLKALRTSRPCPYEGGVPCGPCGICARVLIRAFAANERRLALLEGARHLAKEGVSSPGVIVPTIRVAIRLLRRLARVPR